MNDKPTILVGLAVVLLGLTFPVWHSLAPGRSVEPPDLELPAGRLRCVEETPYMRAHHVDLLDQWRESVVRDGNETYVSEAFGESHRMSLTGTCMACHTNRRTFCDRCHAYVNVAAELNCWECHVDPSNP